MDAAPGQTTNPQVRIHGWRATVTLARPERHNALGVDDIDACVAALERIDAEPDIRVMVLTGTGEKTFCAGFALDEVGTRDREIRAGGHSPFEALTERLERMRVPVICMLNGSVYGGGGELALCCDFRIGVEGMQMFVPPARLGIHYPPIGLRRYVERLGLSNAKRILVACETFNDAELQRIGFLDHLVPRAELSDRTEALAESIASLAPLSVQGMKATLNEIARGTLDANVAIERVKRCGESSDHREALTARRDKRQPVFTGR